MHFLSPAAAMTSENETGRKAAAISLPAAICEALIDDISDLVFTLSQDGLVCHCNAAVSRSLGRAASEIVGRAWGDLLHPEDRGLAATLLRQAQPIDSTPTTAVLRFAHGDGSWRAAEGTIHSWSDRAGFTGTVCRFRDISEPQQIRDQLVHVQRMANVGNLVSGIAHDLNNVLTPILVAAELLENELPPTDRKMLLDALSAGSQRAAAAVDALRTFMRRIRGSAGPANVAQQIDETKRLLEFSFPKSITLHVDLSDSLWAVGIRDQAFAQILLNLCLNARDAMPEGGCLRVTANNVTLTAEQLLEVSGLPPGRYVSIEVADSGIGISPELRRRIFDRDFNTQTDAAAIGLGLPIAVEILRHERGLLRCDSEPGQGTQMKFYLPAISARSAATDQGPANDPPHVKLADEAGRNS